MRQIVIAGVLVVCGLGQAHAEVKQVTGALSGGAEGEAPAVLDGLEDGDVVMLDLNMSQQAWPAILGDEGSFETPDSCAYGMIEGVEQIGIPTGSNHLLMTVRPGDPDMYAANGLSCEYDPSGSGADPENWAHMRLTGCYLARAISIPTARELVLNPLPGSACGLHD